MPLLRNGTVVGTLVVNRTRVAPFAERQIELLKTFADQAVIAIQNARLFDEVQAKTRDLGEALEQQTATADVLKVISRSAFDLQSVIDTLTTVCGRSARPDSGSSACATATCFAIAAAGAFWTEAKWRYLAGPSLRPGRSTAAGRAILSGHIEQIPDYARRPGIRRAACRPRLEQSPGHAQRAAAWERRIERRDGPRRQEPGPFSQRAVDILQTFADQAVIAIENTRLFNETQEALEQQNATADISASSAIRSRDPQPVFDKILRSIEHLFGADERFVFRVGDDGLLHIGAVMAPMPNAPTRAVSGAAAAEARARSQFASVGWSSMPTFQRPRRTSRLREARAPVRQALLMVVAPMLWEDRAIGSIFVGRTSHGRPVQRKAMQPAADLRRSGGDRDPERATVRAGAGETRNLGIAEQQTATADVLKVISRSVARPAPVFDTISNRCERLFGPCVAAVHLVEGDRVGAPRTAASRARRLGSRFAAARAKLGRRRRSPQRRSLSPSPISRQPDLPDDKRRGPATEWRHASCCLRR